MKIPHIVSSSPHSGNRHLQAAFAALGALALPLAPADAATVTFNPAVPTFDGDDITQLQTGTLATTGTGPNNEANYIAANQKAGGQTFTVGATGTISAITLKAAGSFSQIDTGTQLTLRISTVSGTTLTPVLNEAATPPTMGASNGTFFDYITFTLTTPLQVTAGQYGFDLGGVTTGNFYFQIDGAPDSTFAGGTAYTSGANGVGNTTATFLNTDRTFGVAFTPVPEPSGVALAMLGSLAAMSMRRRRN